MSCAQYYIYFEYKPFDDSTYASSIKIEATLDEDGSIHLPADGEYSEGSSGSSTFDLDEEGLMNWRNSGDQNWCTNIPDRKMVKGEYVTIWSSEDRRPDGEWCYKIVDVRLIP